MNLLSFSQSVLSSESKCVSFLQDHGLIPREKKCVCGRDMRSLNIKHKSGNHGVTWECTYYRCRKKQSVRSDCSFLAFKRSDGRIRCSISLCQLMHLLYLYLNTYSTCRQLHSITSIGLPTIVDWLNLIREVCTHSIVHSQKLVGTTESPIQIDESYFRGRRKYGKGRLLEGDYNTKVGFSRKNNYGTKINGPWVLGIYKSASEVRFILVDDRRRSTLIPIIEDHVEVGSTIVTDEWAAYNGLEKAGFLHYTVNHSQNYVDPITGYHTQGVERAWKDAKSWLRRAKYPTHLIQSHLDFLSWKKKHQNSQGSLLDAFLLEVRKYYVES